MRDRDRAAERGVGRAACSRSCRRTSRASSCRPSTPTVGSTCSAVPYATLTFSPPPNTPPLCTLAATAGPFFLRLDLCSHAPPGFVTVVAWNTRWIRDGSPAPCGSGPVPRWMRVGPPHTPLPWARDGQLGDHVGGDGVGLCSSASSARPTSDRRWILAGVTERWCGTTSARCCTAAGRTNSVTHAPSRKHQREWRSLLMSIHVPSSIDDRL